MDNQILAAIEIADHEVRLLVGQFYNGRLNILKVEAVAHLGISGYTIMSEAHIIDAIRKAIENASRNLGVVISKVILVVPGINFKRISLQKEITIAAEVSAANINQAYREFADHESPEGHVLINTLINKYYINGSSTRKPPLNERCETMIIEGDNYYGKQSLIFSYVFCIEKAGIKIMDIVLDDIGYAKEASLFESSVRSPVLGITLSEKTTRLSLFNNGKLVSNDYLDIGFSNFMKKLEKQYKLSRQVTRSLLYHNIDLNNSNPHSNPVFVWATHAGSQIITQKDVVDLVDNDIRNFLAEVYRKCEPIIEVGNVRCIISGDASEISGIDAFFSKISSAQTSLHRPSTFGIKNGGFTSVAGAFYHYKDQSLVRQRDESSIDEELFKKIVMQHDSPNEESITKKLKGILFERN